MPRAIIGIVPFEIRQPDGDPRAYVDAIGLAFSELVRDRDAELFMKLLEPDRALAAYDGDRIVGTAAAISVDLTVPGGMLPVAGVTTVGVHPTHRRRGILRQMMERQLADVHERGEPLAILWASEGGIYQRFGYGLATLRAGIKVDRQYSAYRRVHEWAGSLRFIGEDDARKAFPPVYDAARLTRVGFFSASPAFWDAEVFYFPEHWRHGRGEPLHVLHETDGTVDGYVRYAIRSNDTSEVSVLDMISATPAAHLDLWRFLLDIDLMNRVEAWNVAPDDPVILAMAEPRRLDMTLGDALWLRIVDIAPALAGRRYRTDGRIVFDLVDELLPHNHGRWSLTVEGGVPLVEPTSDAADIAVDVTDLGATYLGGFTFSQLAASRRASELQPGALERGDLMFGTGVAPWVPRVF
jgi:predicted acetyltransferase